MRFYTPAVYDATYDYTSDNGGDNFAAVRVADAAYTSHIKSTLPPHLLELALLKGVDNGLIVEAHLVRAVDDLTFVLRCGDLIMGYYDLVPRYKGVVLTPEHERTLSRLARTKSRIGWRGCTGRGERIRRKTLNYVHHSPDMFWQEVDIVESGLIEHRFLFHPGHWFTVGCASLEWERIERPNRELPPMPDRFPGGAIWRGDHPKRR